MDEELIRIQIFFKKNVYAHHRQPVSSVSRLALREGVKLRDRAWKFRELREFPPLLPTLLNHAHPLAHTATKHTQLGAGQEARGHTG